MPELLLGILILLVVAGFAAIFLILRRRGAAGGGVEEELRGRINDLEADNAELRQRLQIEHSERVQTQTRLEAEREKLAEQRKLLEEAETKLKDAFKALSADALKANREQFLSTADERLKPIRETLDAYQKRLGEVEKARAESYSGLREYLDSLQAAQEGLRTQTTKLETALRGSTRVRGEWGQLALRRVVELAGMSKHCDFQEQTSAGEESRQRPDLTVRLPGDRVIVVDAKAPLDAYMEAVEAGDDASRKAAMARHAGAVRGHVRALGQKAYWSQFRNTPEFVVLFLPGESFFSAALEADPALMEDAFGSNVVLASPANLIALLKAVAHGWRQQEMAENAQRIGETGRELYERLCTFLEHFEKIGAGLDRAQASYNDAVGSFERRVRPSAVRLAEQSAATKELPEPDRAETPRRSLDEPEALPEPAGEAADDAKDADAGADDSGEARADDPGEGEHRPD